MRMSLRATLSLIMIIHFSSVMTGSFLIQLYIFCLFVFLLKGGERGIEAILFRAETEKFL